MALTNIEYGSLASSETLNNNFSYLDEKINDSNTQVNTSISSILSNIATINSRLSEISEDLSTSVSSINSALSEYKTKTKLLVANSCIVPNWVSCREISLTSGTDYTAPLNGYIFVLTDSTSRGNLTINGSTVVFKVRDNAYDNAASLAAIPVMEGDTVSTTVSVDYAYFVPAAEISVENF